MPLGPFQQYVIENHLFIQNISLSTEELKQLLTALQESKEIGKLTLEHASISEKEADLLADFLKHNTHITELSLSHNQLGDGGASSLAKAIKVNTTLVSLFLSDNKIGNFGIFRLAQSLRKNTTLSALDLQGNEIGNFGATALSRSLADNRTIMRLGLTSNNIGRQGGVMLAQGLETNRTMTHLYLAQNKIENNGALAFADMLKKNRTLQCLNIQDNSIDSNGAEAITRSYVENDTLTILGCTGLDLTTFCKISLIVIRNRILQDIASNLEAHPLDLSTLIQQGVSIGSATDVYCNLHVALLRHQDRQPDLLPHNAALMLLQKNPISTRIREQFIKERNLETGGVPISGHNRLLTQALLVGSEGRATLDASDTHEMRRTQSVILQNPQSLRHFRSVLKKACRRKRPCADLEIENYRQQLTSHFATQIENYLATQIDNYFEVDFASLQPGDFPMTLTIPSGQGNMDLYRPTRGVPITIHLNSDQGYYDSPIHSSDEESELGLPTEPEGASASAEQQSSEAGRRFAIEQAREERGPRERSSTPSDKATEQTSPKRIRLDGTTEHEGASASAESQLSEAASVAQVAHPDGGGQSWTAQLSRERGSRDRSPTPPSL